MKSYTDLEQSKKLAEILPIESADMSWVSNGLGKPFARTIPIKGDPEELCGCWSLTALLGVIPYNVTFNRAVYRFELVKYSDHWECYHENFGMVSTEIFKADNPVDACVAMIEKLHELNLL